jgi:hypothetical protein
LVLLGLLGFNIVLVYLLSILSLRVVVGEVVRTLVQVALAVIVQVLVVNHLVVVQSLKTVLLLAQVHTRLLLVLVAQVVLVMEHMQLEQLVEIRYLTESHL